MPKTHTQTHMCVYARWSWIISFIKFMVKSEKAVRTLLMTIDVCMEDIIFWRKKSGYELGFHSNMQFIQRLIDCYLCSFTPVCTKMAKRAMHTNTKKTAAQNAYKSMKRKTCERTCIGKNVNGQLGEYPQSINSKHTYENSVMHQGATHGFRTHWEKKLYDFFFIFISLSHSPFSLSVCCWCLLCLSVLFEQKKTSCMYRLENNFLWCSSLGKFIPFVFVPLSFICLFACLHACLCVRSLAFVRLDCWMSLIHFYRLIICMDGVFNEIGDRLIRRQHKMYNFPKSSPVLHICTFVHVRARAFHADAAAAGCRFYFGNFVIPFRDIVICTVFTYAFNTSRKKQKTKQQQ